MPADIHVGQLSADLMVEVVWDHDFNDAHTTQVALEGASDITRTQKQPLLNS